MHDLEFNFKPSSYYLLFMTAIFLLSMIIVSASPLAVMVRLTLLLLLSAYGAWIVWQFGLLRSRYSVIGIKRKQDGIWLVRMRGQEYHAELCGDSTVTRLVSVLRFRMSHQRRVKSCVVFADALQRDDYRKLMIALRMQ